MRGCRVKVIPVRELNGVFPELQPEIGKIYEAEYVPDNGNGLGFCVVEIQGKKVIMRKGAFAIIS